MSKQKSSKKFAVIAIILGLVVGLALVLMPKFMVPVEDPNQPEPALDIPRVVMPVADENGTWYADVSEEDKALFSLPEDPWAVAAPASQGNFAVFPFVKDRAMTTYGTSLQDIIDYTWRTYMPAGIGSPRLYTLNATIRTCAPFPDDGESHVIDDELADLLVTYYDLSHYLRGEYREEGDQVYLDLELTTPSGTQRHTLNGKRNEVYRIASRVNEWLVPALGFEYEPGMADRLIAPIFGDDYLDPDDPVLAGLWKSAGDPLWDKLIARNPDSKVLPFFRANVAWRLGESEMSSQLDPGPLGADAEPWERLVRIVALYGQQKLWVGFHDSEVLIAQRPDCYFSIDRFTDDFIPSDFKRGSYVEFAERWHDRTGRSPAADEFLAAMYWEAAYSYRGSHWASTVSPLGWQKLREYGAKASDLYRGIMEECTPIPACYYNLSTILAVSRGVAGMEEIHQQCIARYPDYAGTWGVKMNFTRPRWGGSDAKAKELMEEILALDSKNPDFYSLVMTYHWEESLLEVYGERIFPELALRKYCKNHPEALDELNRAVEKLMLCKPAGRGHARAFSIAMALDDTDAKERIIKSLPISYAPWAYLFEKGIRGVVLYHNIWALYEIAEFEEMLNAVTDALEHDAMLPSIPENVNLFALSNNLIRNSTVGIALLMNEQLAEAEPLLDKARNSKDWWSYLLPAELSHGIIHEKTDSALAHLLATDGESEDPYLLQAMLYKLRDEDEKAMESYNAAEGKKASGFEWLRPKTREMLGLPAEG